MLVVNEIKEVSQMTDMSLTNLKRVSRYLNHAGEKREIQQQTEGLMSD